MPNFLPEMLVLGRKTRFHIDDALTISGCGLRVGGWMENRRPRICSDGSVIAIAQDTGITVLTKKAASGKAGSSKKP
jgi:hypothetical protein